MFTFDFSKAENQYVKLIQKRTELTDKSIKIQKDLSDLRNKICTFSELGLILKSDNTNVQPK